MPLYEYECPKDGVFELVRKFSDPPLAACPKCSGPIEKLASAPAIQFKGTGWYVTDYARKGQTDGGASKAEKAEKTEKADKAASKESKDSKDSGSSKSTDKGSSSTSTSTPSSSSSTDKK